MYHFRAEPQKDVATLVLIKAALLKVTRLWKCLMEMLDKKHYVFVINVFAHIYYFAFFISPIKIRVEIAKIRLISPFSGFW